MNQLFAVALGGSCGAVLRFLVANGINQWLGKGFPYGTLTVNIIGSFLLGLLTEALILNRVAFSMEYRAAILVGFIGAFTTFSTFSLDTVYLLQQGNSGKALLNVLVSVGVCLLAVWLGLLSGKGLADAAPTTSDALPYSLWLMNAIGAFLIAVVMTLLLQKTQFTLAHQLTLALILCGSFLTLSGLYMVLHALEQTPDASLSNAILLALAGNTVICLLVLWLGYLTGKQLAAFDWQTNL
jgi:CrcB protein